MASPTYPQLHPVDVPLTNISISYRNSAYVADEIFPAVPINRVTGRYFVYTKADWFRREAGVRAPGTRAPRGDYGLSTAQYVCIEYAMAKGITDEDVDNALDPLQPLSDGTEWVTNQILLQREYDVSALAFGTGWSSSATPTTLWSADAADPVGDVETGRDAVVKAIGQEANKGVMGRGLWRYAKQHPDIVDRLKGSAGPANPAIVTVQAVAALFSLEKLLIGTAISDTAAEGASSTLAYLWGNHLLLAYVASNPSLLNPSAGYTFNFRNREVTRFREDQERQDVVECRQNWDSVISAADAGYLVKSAA